MEPGLWLERFPPQVGLEPTTARSVGLGLSGIPPKIPEILGYPPKIFLLYTLTFLFNDSCGMYWRKFLYRTQIPVRRKLYWYFTSKILDKIEHRDLPRIFHGL